MDYRVAPQERAAFKRCRRQWDLGALERQNLQVVDALPIELDRAVREALAMYYYPGMWDWPSAVVLPLVRKAFMRAVAASPPSAQRTNVLDLGTDLLERYFTWAPAVDDFGPVKIEADVDALVPDLREADRALATTDGRRVLYVDRIPLVAVDAADEYWVVTHQVVPEWRAIESLLLDEASVAACWVWEQTYLGMEIAGTIHNEILSPPPADLASAPTATRTGRPGRGGYSQNEPSGGGRSLPQVHRADRLATRPAPGERVQQETTGLLRRTRIRRNRSEIEAASRQIGAEIQAMLEPALALYPTPSPAHCPVCLFTAPCLTMMQGEDPAPELAAGFRKGPNAPTYEPRLGADGGLGRAVVIPPPPPRP